ncbi:hypothetical protein BDR03DRAFT_948687 [Suillus americanus]|nr:hypothetical protein BDR03DRAFT_948687 [Suillus americanus]
MFKIVSVTDHASMSPAPVLAGFNMLRSGLATWSSTAFSPSLPSDNIACETRGPKNSVDSPVACVSNLCCDLG